MLVGEAIERVKSEYVKGMPTDDSRLSDRLAYSKLSTVRAKFAGRRAKSTRFINPSFLTTIDSFPLEESDFADCPELKQYCTTVYKSVYKLPKVVSGNDSLLIDNISNFNYDVKFNYLTQSKLKYLRGRKFTSNDLYFYIKNDYLYTINSEIENITLTALFFDPIKAQRISSLCSESALCLSNYELDFAVPDDDILEDIITTAARELVSVLLSVPDDRDNDSRDRQGEPIRYPQQQQQQNAEG